MTTLNQAGEAIVEKFDTALGLTVPYTLSEEPYDSEVTWVRLTYKLATGGISSLGAKTNRQYERLGIIFAQVFTPKGNGSGEAEILAQTIQNLYEGETFSGIWGLDGNIQAAGESGAWYQVNVDINFKFHETK